MVGYTGFRGDEFAIKDPNVGRFDPETGSYQFVMDGTLTPFEHPNGIPIPNYVTVGRFTKPGTYRIGVNCVFNEASAAINFGKFSKIWAGWEYTLPFLLYCMPGSLPQTAETASVQNSIRGAPQYCNELILQSNVIGVEDTLSAAPWFWQFGPGITFDFTITKGGTGAALIIPLTLLQDSKTQKWQLEVYCVDYKEGEV